MTDAEAKKAMQSVVRSVGDCEIRDLLQYALQAIDDREALANALADYVTEDSGLADSTLARGLTVARRHMEGEP